MTPGNTVLHASVIHGHAEMYAHLITTYQPTPWARNAAGQTPLLLAMWCGSASVVDAVLDGIKQTLWAFGPVSCVRYPLYDIETASPELASSWGGNMSRRCALEVLVNQKRDVLLYTPLIWSLTNDKWVAFGRAVRSRPHLSVFPTPHPTPQVLNPTPRPTTQRHTPRPKS